MEIWSTQRIVTLLTIWAVVIPFKINVYLPRLDYSIMYAGLWSYLPRGNPFSDSPFIVSLYFTASLLPFYAPGLAVAWYVWKWSRDENMTRGRYFERLLLIVILQTILAMIIPCPMDVSLCVPTPTTGLIALLFSHRIVIKIEEPWTE
ncbi:MAG: hypothetical protein ACFFE2_12535 [Candidatus Thorarchaeota archaeon]